MSVEEFLLWDSHDGLRYELVDGVPRAMAPPRVVHGLLQSELGSLLRNHLRAHHTAYQVISNPGVVPRLLSAHNFRVPDLGVTCSPVTPTQAALIEPVLLIEILSPGNQAETWSNVWTYTSIPTVQEILILHSTRIAAELLRRADDGTWPERPEQLAGGDLVLRGLDFRVPLAALYEATGLTA